MDRGSERSLVLAALLLAAAVVIDMLVGRQTRMLVFPALCPLLWSGLLVTLLAWLRMHLARRAVGEAREEAALQAGRQGGALFDESEIQPFTIRRTQQQVERVLVPVFTAVLGLLQGYFALSLAETLRSGLGSPGDALLATSFLIGQAFFLFLFGRYLLGLGRVAATRVARGPGIYLSLAALASFAAASAALASTLIHPTMDPVVAWILFGLVAALAVENILTLVVGIYSPRRTSLLSTAYHSRLGGFLTDPAGWVRNLAGAVDYQFGFNVSDTWFYRVAQRTLLPLFGLLVLALYLMSCFVFVNYDEVAVREHFGKPPESGWKLDSGFHLKWPWPFETIRRVPAKRVLTTHIGHHADPSDVRRDLILWTVPHYAQEDLLLVAASDSGDVQSGTDGSVGLVSMNVPVGYKVSDARQYLYSFREPHEVIHELAQRALIQAIAHHDLDSLMGKGRLEVAAQVEATLQAEADALALGIDVLYVGMQGLHPPVDVAADFQKVVAALESKEAAILDAEAYTIGMVPEAAAAAAQAVSVAEAIAVGREELSGAEAYQFGKRAEVDARATVVFRNDLYLTSLARGLDGTAKYIIDPGDAEIIVVWNEEEKLGPQDLFNISPDSNQEKRP